MAQFASKPLKPSVFLVYVRKHPFFLFGLPFISIMIASSYALEQFTQTRYDLHSQKVQTMTWEENMGMKEGRKKVDLKEEYYKLSNPAYAQMAAAEAALNVSPSHSTGSEGEEQTQRKSKKKFSMTPISQDDLENVRVARPEGVPEWGAPRSTDAPVKGKRKEDRWV